MAQEINKETVSKFMEVKTKEAKKDFKPRKPDYKVEGVAVWRNVDKNGEEYLAVKIKIGVHALTLNVFRTKD